MQFTAFSSLSRQKAGGSRPRPGPTARDRASLSRRWFQRGQAPTRCVTRHSGVEPCSSGVHVDAGHHTTLAPVVSRVVSVANIVQEVKTGTNTATQDPNPSVQLSERTRRCAHPSRCGWKGHRHPAASSRPGAVVQQQQLCRGFHPLGQRNVGTPGVSLR